MGGRPSRRSWTSLKALLEVQDRSKILSGGPGGVGSPSQRSEMGREALLEVRDGWEALPEVWNGLEGPPESPGVPP